MSRFRLIVYLFVLLVFVPVASFAEEAPAEGTPVDASTLINEDLARKLELAGKMHQFRPAKDQVNNAINKISNAMPANEKEVFRTAMRNILNYQAIEKISIDAMAETYTLKELVAMVEYYSKPEARSASDKYGEYSQKVSPEITKMIDKAMMRVRAGSER